MRIQELVEKVVAGLHQPPALRRRPRRAISLRGAMIGPVEPLEARRMLSANVVTVTFDGSSLVLMDATTGKGAKGDSVTVAYTATAVTLTGNNGTQFLVDGKAVATDNVTISSAINLSIWLNTPASTVQITGDGVATLNSLYVNFGTLKSANSLTMTKVLANSIAIDGSHGTNTVTLSQSTVNGPLTANLGRKAGDILHVTQSTVTGDAYVTTQQFFVDHATFDGSVTATEVGNSGLFDAIASTFKGVFYDNLGANAVINMHTSADGPTTFKSSETIVGKGKKHPTTLNAPANSVVNNVAPSLTNVTTAKTPPVAPTVNNVTSQTAVTTLTGTWDSASATALKVTVGSTTYVLGTDNILTTSGGAWTLNLTAVTLPAGATTVTVVNTDKNGLSSHGTGTITMQGPNAPTVNSLSSGTPVTTLTGTWDATLSKTLKVTVGTTTYTLGTDAVLTTPTTGNWSLDLTGVSLPAGVTNVTVVTSDTFGSSQATGTITLQVPAVPTVKTVTSAVTPSTVTGTYDATLTKTLKVTVGTKTYTLGTDAALTAPSTGTWSLDLTGVTLPKGANTVTVVSSNGGSSQGTGTITVIDPAELTSIHTFLTANSLTATQTSTGLNYVITTLGTGAIHKAGDSLTVKYVGKILNADGTLGTQFDANSTGFQFTLGGNVIAGWNEAFALLPVGTVAKLLIPAALAYGASSPSSSIPANSILEFDVTLVS